MAKKKFGAGNTIYQFPVGEKTLESYRREVRNTKAKIRRIQKEYDIDLNAEINIPSLESFSSRKEFNEWVRKSQSFRNRSNRHYQYEKNPYGVSASKAKLDKIERENKKAIKLAEEKVRELENKPFISGGVVQGTVGMQRPNKSGISVPAEFDFKDVRTKERLREIEENMARKSNPDYYDKRNKRMQDNFIDMLEKSFNSQADVLIEVIRDIHPDEFYQMYLQIDEFDFTDYYLDADTVALEDGEIGRMLTEIDRYDKGEYPYTKDLHHKNFNKS